jgi:hypothetical protein
VLGLRSNRGKLLELMSSRIRWPGRNTLLVAHRSIVYSYTRPGSMSVGWPGGVAISSPDYPVLEVLGVTIGVHVNEFGREVGVLSRRCRPQMHNNGACHFRQLLHRFGREYENILPVFRRGLVLNSQRNRQVRAAQRWHRIVRIINVSISRFVIWRNRRQSAIAIQRVGIAIAVQEPSM